MNLDLIEQYSELLNKLAPGYINNTMDTKVRKYFDQFYANMKERNILDWDSMNTVIASRLQFKKFATDLDISSRINNIVKNVDDPEIREVEIKKLENVRNLYLIPLWIYPLIPSGIKITSLSGEIMVYDGHLNMDVMYGCLGYGIHPKTLI